MKLLSGDITKIKTDALVNAANTQLQHGGGVAAEIAAAGGEVIQKESVDIGWCDIGKAAVTGAGKLPAKCVIHVPTIDYTTGKKADLEDIINYPYSYKFILPLTSKNDELYNYIQLSLTFTQLFFYMSSRINAG